MSESAPEPVLAEEPEAPKKPAKRRTASAAKPRATVSAAKKLAGKAATGEKAVAEQPEAAVEAAVTKPKTKRPSRKKAAAGEELPGFETATAVAEIAAAATPEPVPAVEAQAALPEPPAAPAPKEAAQEAQEAQEAAEPAQSRRTSAEGRGPRGRAGRRSQGDQSNRNHSGRNRNQAKGPNVVAPNAAAMPVEEWSPSRRAEPIAAPEATPMAAEPVPKPAEPAPAAAAPTNGSAPAAPVSATPEGAAPAAQPPRKYPVYIPRHVAKQMEQQGQTAPIAVPADAIPEAARAAVEAAQAAQAAAQAAAAARAGARAEARAEAQNQHQHRHQNQNADNNQNQRESYETTDEDLGVGEGIVEISGKGFGFIRDAKRGFAQHPQDIFVTPEIVRRYNLRDGQWIKGETRRGGRGAQLSKMLEINGGEPEEMRILPAFDELTVISPMERITLETVPDRYTTRIIDLFTPIGKGQRGIIVAPPRTGKTTLLQHIADAVVKHHPDIKLILLLVDERPEEVTDFKRTIPSAEVMASSNDMDVKSHTRIAQLAVERAKRLVESGQDVFILLDSITRVGRAFNNAMTGGGRTMSGGVDARALEIPRRLFAAARNTEEAGSLTVVATALIETGSKMDDLIFQEFKGTGNMELVLDRKIAEQRIYPAVDLFLSGTRREELLIPADDLHKIALIRRGLSGHKPMEAIERLLFFLRKFPTNAQMLREIPG